MEISAAIRSGPGRRFVQPRYPHEIPAARGTQWYKHRALPKPSAGSHWARGETRVLLTWLRKGKAALLCAALAACASDDGANGSTTVDGIRDGAPQAAGGGPGAGGALAPGSGGQGAAGGGPAGGADTGAGGLLAGGGPGAGGWSAGGGTPGAGGTPAAAGSAGATEAGGSPGTGCETKRGMLRGPSSQTVVAAGVPRTMLYYAPLDLDPTTPVPLLIVPHGFDMNGQDMFDITGYAALADRDRFVVVFPEGEPGSLGPWNVGAGVCGAGAFAGAAGDDQAFIDATIEFVARDQCLDRDHVFVSGFSMGGYFANEIGCLRRDIAGIASHSGGTHALTDCPGSMKPVLLLHFEDDELVDYGCGTEARNRWVARNGCNPIDPEVRPVQGGACEYYRECPDHAQVAFCTFNEAPTSEAVAGHAWSGGAPHDYSHPESASATEISWGFFKEFAW